MTDASATQTCPICESKDAARKLSKNDTQIYACPRCGVQFWVPHEGFAPEALYDDHYFSDPEAGAGYDDYGAQERSLRANFAHRLKRLPMPGIGDRLLDIGAAYGFAMDEARRAGWIASGIEVDRAVARKALPATGPRVAVADALRLPFPDSCFAAVTLWDVLEHLKDPHMAIDEVARVLRPEGRLVLTTGDVESLVARVSGPRWHLYTLPEHLFFYTRSSLRRLLSAHGLEIESLRTEGSRYSLAYLWERLRKSLLGREGKPPGEGAIWRLAVPINLFDIVTVVATRTGNRSVDGA